MKKITLLLMLGTFVFQAYGQYPQVLPIDYSQFFATTAMGDDPTLEKGQYTSTSAAIMPNQWNRSGKSSDQNGVSPTVEANTLSYSTYIDNSMGKAINLAAIAGLRTTPYSLTSSSADYTGKTFYVGMLVNFTSVSGSGQDFFAFDSNHTGNAQRGRVFVKASLTEGSYVAGIGFGGAGDVLTWSADLAYGTSYLFVASIEVATSGNETIKLYIDPTLGSVESANTPVNSGSYTAALKKILALSIRQRPEFAGKVAGLRFSDNWADVVKSSSSSATQLSTPTVGAPTVATANGFTANWSTVENAESYDVKVYLESNLVSSVNVSGQTSTSLVLSGLMPGQTYTYKVVAQGDGVAYSASEPSIESASIMTLDPYATNVINTDFSNEALWGEPSASSYTSGSYPSNMVNGFDLVSAGLQTGSSKDLKGILHSNRISVDKSTYGSLVTFPTINSLEQIEIHASFGSGEKNFSLQEFEPATNSWTNVGTYTYAQKSKDSGMDSIYTIAISKSTPTKFRIVNNTTSTLYIYQIISRTTNPTSLAIPVVGATSGLSSTGFTANWTAVGNATGYVVRVYDAGSLTATVNVSGQATVSQAIAELTAETAYTYTVQAKGDGDLSYLDSFMSVAVAVTTSIATSLDKTNIAAFATVQGKNIKLNEVGNIDVFNMLGKNVLNAKNVMNITTNLTNGLYIVRFSNSAGEEFIQKITIK